jgi:hypothetical protein
VLLFQLNFRQDSDPKPMESEANRNHESPHNTRNHQVS